MRWKGLALFLLTFGSTMLGTTAGQQVVNFRGHDSWRCIEVQGASQDNSATVDIYDCIYGATNELWTLKPITAQYHQIIASHSGKCLTVASQGTTDNSAINQYDCTDGADNQLWELVPSSSTTGYSQIRGKQSGLCVTAASADTENGVLVNIYDCQEGGNQLWGIIETTSGSWVATSDSLVNTGGVIIGVDSTRCVTIAAASTLDNAVANLYDCTQGATNQQWTVKVNAGNYFELVVAHSEKCLTVASSATDNNSPLNQYTCTEGADNQLWQIIKSSNGKTQIQGKGSGRCVTASSTEAENGAGLIIQDCTGANEQLWTVQGNPNAIASNLLDLQAVYNIIGSASSRCVDVNGGIVDDNAVVNIYDCNTDATNEQWSAKLTSPEFLQLVAKHSGKCLTVASSGTDNNSPVNQYECTDGADNQLWSIVGNLNSEVQIRGKGSGRCLTTASAGTDNGVTLNIYDCLGAGNQLWTFKNVFRASKDTLNAPVYKLNLSSLNFGDTGMSMDAMLVELGKYAGKADLSDLISKFAKQTAWHDSLSFWLNVAQLSVTSPLRFIPAPGPMVADAIYTAYCAISLLIPDKPDIYAQLAESIVGRRIDENNYKQLMATMKGIRDIYQTFTEYMKSPPYSNDTQNQIFSKFDNLVGYVEAVLPQFLMDSSEYKAGGFPLFGLASSVAVQAYITILRSPDLPMSDQKWQKNYELLYKFIHRRHREISSATRTLIKNKSEADELKAVNTITMYGVGLFNAVARKFFGLKFGRKDIKTRISNEFYPYHRAEYRGTVKEVVNKDILKRVSPLQRLAGWSAKIGTARIEYDTLDAFGNNYTFAYQACDGSMETPINDIRWSANQLDKSFGSNMNSIVCSAWLDYYDAHFDPNSLGRIRMRRYDNKTTDIGDVGKYPDPELWFGSPGYFMNSVMMTGGNRHFDCWDFDFINVPTVTFRHLSSFEYIPYFDSLNYGIELDSTNGYYYSSPAGTGINEPFLGKTTITSKKITFVVYAMVPEKLFAVNINAILSPGDSTPIKVWASAQNTTLTPMFGNDSDTMSGVYSNGKFKFYEGTQMLNLYKGIDNEVTIYTDGAPFEFASLTLTP